MQHGSLHNLVMGSTGDEIKVGMGATRVGWSDRSPYTVVEIVNDKTLVLQEDNYTRTDNNGMSESQEYDYSPNPEGSKATVTLRKNGAWVEKGESTKNGTRYTIGNRDRYYDYSF